MYDDAGASPGQPIVTARSLHSGRQAHVPRRRKPSRKPTPAEEYEPEPVEARLIRNPHPKAVAPYTPKSELEDVQLRFLIYHYVTVVTERTVTNVGPRWEWYPLAVRDSAFFHAVISSTASHAAYLQQVDLPKNFYHHRGEAIRQVNERIRRGAHDEGTINAVAVFSQQEAFEGRPETALTHINGLITIVRAAGPLNLSAHTRRHIIFTDLAASIALDRKPVLEPDLDLSNLEALFGRPSPATALYVRTFGTRLFNFTGSPLADVAANVLWGLRNISERLERIREKTESVDTALATDLQFTDQVEVLERLAHTLWYAKDRKAAQHPIFRSLGWATCIYIYTVLRELPKEMGMNAMLASRIKRALEHSTDLNVFLATFQDLLLWQMFLCGGVANSRDRLFFAQQATKILMVRKTENPNEIMAASREFLWPERRPAIVEEEPGMTSSSEGTMEI